jgi:hypothetical protein
VRVPTVNPTEPHRIRKAPIVAAGLICTVLALLAVPAVVSAKPGYIVFPGYHEVELSLRGSHGYSIQVTKTNRFIEMFVDRDPDQAAYLIRRRQAKDDGIEAELPGIGRISVEFHPVGPPRKEGGFFPPCKGGKTTKQRGYFQGTIRIRGERGYTSAHTDRASGEVATVAKEICKRSTFNHSKSIPAEGETRLFATSGPKHGRSVALSADTVTFGSTIETFFVGFTSERREGMTIFRQAFVRGTAADFALGDTGDYPTSATVSPPAPFHGSADFLRNPGGENSWTGSLSVDLPGLGRVALAGPSFSTKLCRDSGCRSARNQSAYGRRLIRGRVPAGPR